MGSRFMLSWRASSPNSLPGADCETIPQGKKVGASRFGEAPTIDRIPYYGLSLAQALTRMLGVMPLSQESCSLSGQSQPSIRT